MTVSNTKKGSSSAVLTINGKEAFSLRRTRPVFIKIKEYLDKAPHGNIDDNQTFMKKLDISKDSTTHAASSEMFVDYTEKIGTIRYWGHPKAIAQLRLQLEEASRED